MKFLAAAQKKLIEEHANEAMKTFDEVEGIDETGAGNSFLTTTESEFHFYMAAQLSPHLKYLSLYVNSNRYANRTFIIFYQSIILFFNSR